MIGFDDIPLAGSQLVQLSTVNHRVYGNGLAREELEPSLVMRVTCGGGAPQ